MIRRPLPMHWRYRGEIACGVSFSRSQHERRTTADERKVTCPKCIAVQFAMVGAWRELSLHDDDVVHAVQEALAALPRHGWDATTIRKAYERAKG